MSAPLTAFAIVSAIGLVAAVGWLLWRRQPLAWPYLGLSSLTCAICFTVGGATGAELKGPDLATLMGAFVGMFTVLAAIISLVPRHHGHESPARVPKVIGAVSVIAGAVALVVTAATT